MENPLWDRVASQLMIRFNADLDVESRDGFIRISLIRQQAVIAYTVLPEQAAEQALADPYGLDQFIEALAASLEDQVRAFSPSGPARLETLYLKMEDPQAVGWGRLGFTSLWLETNLAGAGALLAELSLDPPVEVRAFSGNVYNLYRQSDQDVSQFVNEVRRVLQWAIRLEALSEVDTSLLPDPPSNDLSIAS